MKKYICVYDFETDGNDANRCEPVQIAALMIHPNTLEVVEGSEFTSYMKPEGIDDTDYLDKIRGTTNVFATLEWHANNYFPDYQELSDDEKTKRLNTILDRWRSAPDPRMVFDQFCSYLLKFNANQKRRTKFSAPIRAGSNIRRFDNIILDRLCTRYNKTSKDGEQKIFHPRDNIDIMDLAFYWFRDMEEPKAYNMDELRIFFGMSQYGAHDAMNDVRDESKIIQKFLKLHRKLAPTISFKNSIK